MNYHEKNLDIFTVDRNKYVFAHCISRDYKMGAGVAVRFNKEFNLRPGLLKSSFNKEIGAVYVNGVYNLITKKYYWHKPTYASLTAALYEMRRQIILQGYTHLAMPRIGAGLDKLQWPDVKAIIKTVFADLPIEILICFYDE